MGAVDSEGPVKAGVNPEGPPPELEDPEERSRTMVGKLHRESASTHAFKCGYGHTPHKKHLLTVWVHPPADPHSDGNGHGGRGGVPLGPYLNQLGRPAILCRE
jgi:hypothetical protein